MIRIAGSCSQCGIWLEPEVGDFTITIDERGEVIGEACCKNAMICHENQQKREAVKP